jgi:hypothetical protein
MVADKERAKVLIASNWGGSQLHALSLGVHFRSPLTNGITLSKVVFVLTFNEKK